MTQKHHTDTAGATGTAAATGSPAFIRQICRAVQGELAAVVGYTSNSVFLSPNLPAVAGLYRETAITEMKHYRQLSDLLRNLGASPYLKMQVRPTPYVLNEDADSHAIVVARRMLQESINGEKETSKEYRRISEQCGDEKLRQFFAGLSAEEAGHAKAFAAALCRLDRS